MEQYKIPNNGSEGQSSIGLQVYVFDTTENTFGYLVPVTSDPPEMGSTPDTIEITEADSPVRQYVSDRPDSPSLEFEYNFNANGYNYTRVKANISATNAKVYCLLLPLGSAFLIKATGSTWMTGGNPIRGAFNLTQAEEAIFIANLTDTFTDLGVATKTLEWLGSEAGVGTNALKDIIDFTTMPSGRETEAVKEAKGV